MLRVFALTLVLVAGASCMKMRETVERTVMVRTTGSDLHPAATGYIYKKQNDGEERVIRMGESEVMEELSKLYAAPKPYVHALTKKEHQEKNDENNAESKNDERIIPVKEKAADEHNDHLDGIADDDDYKKIFDEHTAHYGDNTSYEDYLKSLEHFDDGIYKGYYGDSNEDKDGYKGYQPNQKYYNNGAGNYQNGKYESYSYTGKKDNHDDDRQHYDNRDHKDADEHKGALANQKSGAYYKVFSKGEAYKGHGSYGDGGKTSHNYGDGGKHHGAGRGNDEDGSHESRQHKHAHSEKDNDKQGSNHSAEESSQEKPGDFASDGGQVAGNVYGYEIQH